MKKPQLELQLHNKTLHFDDMKENMGSLDLDRSLFSAGAKIKSQNEYILQLTYQNNFGNFYIKDETERIKVFLDKHRANKDTIKIEGYVDSDNEFFSYVCLEGNFDINIFGR